MPVGPLAAGHSPHAGSHTYRLAGPHTGTQAWTVLAHQCQLTEAHCCWLVSAGSLVPAQRQASMQACMHIGTQARQHWLISAGLSVPHITPPYRAYKGHHGKSATLIAPRLVGAGWDPFCVYFPAKIAGHRHFKKMAVFWGVIWPSFGCFCTKHGPPKAQIL